MSRFRAVATVVLTFSAIGITGAWTGRSLAAWASHTSANATSTDVVSSNALTVLSGRSTILSAGTVKHGMALGKSQGHLLTGSVLPSLLVPPLANVAPNAAAVRELDNVDPWSGRTLARMPIAKRLEMETVDPWLPDVAAASPPHGRARLLLDPADPWTGLTSAATPALLD